MRLLLFGGAFDPPHLGHVQLLGNAIQTAKPDKVLVMPVGLPPHKAPLAAQPKWRLQMCACFCKQFANVEISDRELLQSGKSYTLDTVTALQKEYPQAEIFLSIGGDSLLQFHTWRGYQELLLKAVLLVQKREEDMSALYQKAQNLEKEGARVLFSKGTTLAISSTEIRKALLQRADVANYLPPPVLEIIQKEGLYQADGKENEVHKC